MLAKTVDRMVLCWPWRLTPKLRSGECNRERNGITNCQILHSAGSAVSGTLVFNRGTNGQVDDGTGDWGRLEVKAISIDDLAASHGLPDVLFIDVEGLNVRYCEERRSSCQPARLFRGKSTCERGLRSMVDRL